MTRVVPTALANEAIERLLALESPVWMRVHGDSMHPTLRSGDRVALAPVTTREPQPGDIVAVRVPDGLMVHRLIEKREYGAVLTAGDAARRCDDLLWKEDVVGVVVEIERDGRSLAPVLRAAARWRLDTRRVWPALKRTYRRFLPL